MNEKEVAELRRRFRQDRSGISHVRGCYVNENREIVSQFDQPLGVMTQEENEKILGLLKRTLSGTLGKNLLDITFTTQQVVHGEEHKLLMALRSSELGDEEAIQAFFQKVISSVTLEGNYMILLVHDAYDVPYRGQDGEEQEDAYFRYAKSRVRKGMGDRRAYQGNGTPEPFYTLNVTMGLVPLDKLRETAHGYGASVTEYLAAVLIEAILAKQRRGGGESCRWLWQSPSICGPTFRPKRCGTSS